MSRRTLSFAIAGAVICGTAAGAYGVAAPRWTSQQIAYFINPANSGLSEEETVSAIQAGAMSWTSQSGANVLPYFAGKSNATSISRDGINEIFFRANPGDFSHGKTYLWYDSNNRMIEADTALYPGGITFASEVTACAGAGLYLQDVMTHEFGHALGLSHSSVPTASMNPAMPWCSKDARVLDPDDLSKIEALYPAGSPRR